MDAMIYCKDGQCKFVNPTELLQNQSEDEEIAAANQVIDYIILYRYLYKVLSAVVKWCFL